MNNLLAYRETRKLANSQKVEMPFQGRPLTTPTKVLYTGLRKLWERQDIIPNAFPDLETIETFLMWHASNAKGRLNEKLSIKTLLYKVGRFGCMYDAVYHYKIPDTVLDLARYYVSTDLAKELGLEDAEYDKECTDWIDIEIMILYLTVQDEHEYRCNRYRMQLGCIFMLIADDGERIGAITRSDSYREGNIALCYGDLNLFLLPAQGSSSSPRFRLEIKFDNRKNERGKKNKYIEQSYLLRDVPGTCVVSWILALVFMDDALEHYSTPSQIFERETSNTMEIPITFKQSKMHTPLFRRMEGPNNRKLSSTLAISSISVTADAQRVVAAAGSRQHFTFYCIRCGMSNALHDNKIDNSRIKQLMGYSGPSDKIFQKYYQSRKVNIDTGNIYRMQQPRSERTETLNMQYYDQDKDIQDLLASRKRLKRELRDLPSQKESTRAKLAIIRRSIERRKTYIRKHGLRKVRENHFENLLKPSQSSENSESEVPIPPVVRPELSNILYPKVFDSKTTLLAIEGLIAYCTTTSTLHHNSQKMEWITCGKGA
ncbi:hypothetical protein sscle_05g041070 [Sclerotinia sclerotiorum 1980 UF-70]|uniref:Uncharacterized protein n=1 Tax=Sclerotinia sclerotiorum (strain ATCC 18683 / 1980 / Ss-1) TaxID=665079 RepID=A0A1D9Q324_SCLS1|nr:hypothetical protein sscle_05g041070 [Sclerotinia sclerotiorum 1980 UF-70]